MFQKLANSDGAGLQGLDELTWNDQVTLDIFSVLAFQISVLGFRYLSVLKLVMIKKCDNCDNLGLQIKVLPIFCFYQKKYSIDLSHFASV